MIKTFLVELEVRWNGKYLDNGGRQMEVIEWIQNWYHNNCDGDWEHMYGMKIYNVDNPGWAVEIELIDTKFEDKVFEKVQYDNGDEDWLLCFVKDGIFQGNGDSRKLKKILDIFRDWVEE